MRDRERDEDQYEDEKDGRETLWEIEYIPVSWPAIQPFSRLVVAASAAHFLVVSRTNQQLKSTLIKMFLGSFYHSVDFISLVGSHGIQVDTKLKWSSQIACVICCGHDGFVLIKQSWVIIINTNIASSSSSSSSSSSPYYSRLLFSLSLSRSLDFSLSPSSFSSTQALNIIITNLISIIIIISQY